MKNNNAMQVLLLPFILILVRFKRLIIMQLKSALFILILVGHIEVLRGKL